MKQCFSTYFNGYEIVLSKKDVIFNHGYGIVKALYVEDTEMYYIEESLVGIVDENFNFVVDLFPEYLAPKIEIFPNGVIVKHKESEDIETQDYKVYFVPKTDFSIRYDLVAVDFQVVDENLIILKSLVNDYLLMALYNVTREELLTPYYTFIGEFKQDDMHKEMVAQAYIELGNDDYHNKICFYINKSGVVVSDYFNVQTNEIYDKSLYVMDVVNLVLDKINRKVR